MTIVSFYCKDCQLDQDVLAHKVSNSLCEFFQARCRKCNQKVIRHITEKHLDPYFRLSKKIREQRQRLHKDLIQPGEAGFQTYYKKEYDKIERARAEYERKAIENEKRRNEFYKQHSQNIVEKNMAKKVLDKEELLENVRT